MMRGGVGAQRYREYDFRQPIKEDWQNFSRSLLGILVATKAFQRLKYIRFLGGIDYVLIQTPDYRRGNVRHTRFHHSCGVARLALSYAKKVDLSKRDTLTILAAALLHDIGHPPLSHSLEPIFKDIFGVGHHRATVDVITGKTSIGREVFGVLRDEFVDIERVVALVSGQDNSFDEFFSGPINFDTVEGVFRSFTYIANSRQIPNPHKVIDAATMRANDKDRQVVDQFWNYKDRIYRSIINSRMGLISDYVCQKIVFENAKSLDLGDYFGTDSNLFRKIPKLRSALRTLSINRGTAMSSGDTISFRSRKFYIDANHNFFAREDRRRYRQVKQADILQFNGDDTTRFDLRQDFFDDDLPRQLSLFDWCAPKSTRKPKGGRIER